MHVIVPISFFVEFSWFVICNGRDANKICTPFVNFASIFGMNRHFWNDSPGSGSRFPLGSPVGSFPLGSPMGSSSPGGDSSGRVKYPNKISQQNTLKISTSTVFPPG